MFLFHTLVAMKVIVDDMLINVGLTFLAIFVISIVFTADLTISFFTVCMVIATVVNTAGLLQFWGATIDPFFAVIMIIIYCK